MMIVVGMLWMFVWVMMVLVVVFEGGYMVV